MSATLGILVITAISYLIGIVVGAVCATAWDEDEDSES